MSKLLLKISVILILLLSGAALTMGYLLFEQRDMIKGRTQKLENAVIQIAGTIETGDETGATMVVHPGQLSDLELMDVPLNQLAAAARYQFDRIGAMRNELSEAKDTLAAKEENLKKATASLDEATKKHEAAIETIARRDSTIRERDVVVQNLEREKNELDAKVASLEASVNSLQVRNRDMADRLAEQMGRIEHLETHADPSRLEEKLVKGRQGVVLHVDTDWNFVIFDILPESREMIVPDLQLIVHRGEQFVGKVRVANIKDNLAVADIMSDWQQAPVKKDDDVIH